MNKQELIERIEGLKNIFGNKPKYVEIDAVIELISELDEPKKVTIPKFVADYIEFKKKYDFHVYGAMRTIEDYEDKRVPNWFYEGNIEKFCLAWILGYEVEKEKMYRISMPKARNYKNHAQILCEKDSKIFWCGEWHRFRTKFTRKELEEAGFGWVFDCEGIEIKEVE